MVKKSKISKRITKLKKNLAKFLKKNKLGEKIIKALVVVAVLFLVLAGTAYLYKYFSKPNNYRIENKYYGFILQTPKNWIVKENTLYSEENISQILSGINSDKLGNTFGPEVGEIRLSDKKYPDASIDSGDFPSSFPTGSILEITVYYSPVKGPTHSPNLRQASQGFNIGSIFLSHGFFSYEIDGYVHVSPNDKSNGDKIKKYYKEEFNKIISSLKFTR